MELPFRFQWAAGGPALEVQACKKACKSCLASRLCAGERPLLVPPLGCLLSAWGALFVAPSATIHHRRPASDNVHRLLERKLFAPRGPLKGSSKPHGYLRALLSEGDTHVLFASNTAFVKGTALLPRNVDVAGASDSILAAKPSPSLWDLLTLIRERSLSREPSVSADSKKWRAHFVSERNPPGIPPRQLPSLAAR